MDEEKFKNIMVEILHVLNKCDSEMDASMVLVSAAVILSGIYHDELRQQIASLMMVQMKLERVIQELRKEGGEDCDAKGVVASDITGGGGEC